jgi:hypothetical protein
MAMSEPPSWTQQRMDRMKVQYPEFQYSSPGNVLQVDNYAVNNGGAPTDFSTAVMRLAVHAANSRKPQQPNELTSGIFNGQR